jgi:methylmalonyl-CoA/ethylmalonyl-CoA epimerase
MRQGPHHSAQKSTTASPLACSISVAKFASVTAIVLDILLASLAVVRGIHPRDCQINLRAHRPIPERRLPMSHPSEPSTLPAAPARGTRIAHIGVAVRSLQEILPFYRDVLGLPETPLDDADGARIAGLVAGESLVELLEAESPESPIGRFVAKRGPGIHHICFNVDDLDGTLERCRAAGLRLIDDTPRIGAEGKRIAFLHPAATAGVLVELSEY